MIEHICKMECLLLRELLLRAPSICLVDCMEGMVLSVDIEWKVCSYSFLSS